MTELLIDAETARDILTSAFEVSQHFAPDHPVPDGGFAASAAFDLAGEFSAGLPREHDVAMNSLFYGASPPTFDDVIERVHSCAELLNFDR